MCDNECISKGKCEHNEECYDDLCFTSKQLKVVDRWLAEIRNKTIKEFVEMMRNLNTLNCFVYYIHGNIDLAELMEYASEEITELLN